MAHWNRKVFESHGNGNLDKRKWGTERMPPPWLWGVCFKGVVVRVMGRWAVSPGECRRAAGSLGTHHVPSHVLTAWVVTVFGPASRVPGTFWSTHLCHQTLMALLFLSALLAKPYSHRDNEGLICLQQYGAFLHNLHVFFQTQTLSHGVRTSGAGSCYRYMETQTPYLYSSAASSSTHLYSRKVSILVLAGTC